MKENKENLQAERDSDDAVYTDENTPLVSGRGNPIPEMVVSFFVMAGVLAFGLFLLFSDINVSPELFGSQMASKIFAFIITLVISFFILLYAIALCKRVKIYYSQKRELEDYPVDETGDDET